MTVKLNLGAKGRIKATLTDVRDGSKQVIEQNNLLLNGIFNRWFTQNISLLSASTLNDCFLGTGNTPPTPADTGLSGGTLASSSAGRTVYEEALFANYMPELDWPNGNVLYAMFNTDDSVLFVLSDSAPYVTLYNVEEGFKKLSTVLDVPGIPVWGHISPNGKYLALNQEGDYALSIYDISNNFTRTDISANIVGASREGIPNKCHFSPDGRWLAAVFYGEVGVHLYDVEDEFELSTVLGNSSLPIMCKFSPNSEYLGYSFGYTSTNSNQEMRFYKRQANGTFNETDLVQFDYHSYASGTYFDYTPDSKKVFNSANAGSSKIGFHYRDLETGETIYYRISSDGAVQYLAAHPTEGWAMYRYPDWSPPVRRIYTYPSLGDYAHGYFAWPDPFGNVFTFSQAGKYVFILSQQPLLYDLQPANVPSRKMTRAWTFPAGIGTGTVSELYLRASSSSPYSSNPVARVVLGSPIHKTEFHQLDVEWTIELKCDPVVSTYIENGQVDGTPVDCRFELLHMMFHGLCTENIHTLWFGITGTPRLRLGDSNAETNNFFNFGIQGEEFVNFNTANIRIPSPYATDSLERTVRVFLEVDQGNEQPIAEMVMERFARLTFDPPLEKNDSNRLYVDVTFAWERG